MRTTTRVRGSFAYRPLAITAAIALFWGAGLPARAQLVSSSGDVSPVFVAAPVVDLTGQRINVGLTTAGVGTLGSVSITGGGSLTAAWLDVGTGGLGVGTVSVTGTGSVINLTGGNPQLNKLEVGGWGTGTLTVSNGALVACSSPLACPFNQIGNGAGSTGTLAINGGTVSGLGVLDVGLGSLQTGFGTPGAATTANLTITNGGLLATTGSSSVANNTGQTGLVTGNVTIDGAGSQWAITRDLANGGGQAFLNLARMANSVANVTISNGGNLTVIGSRSSPATDNSLPGIQLSPGAGGTSTMTVTTGGSVRIGGDTGILIVGGNSAANSAGANATLNITAGGTVSGIGPNGLNYVSIGRNQANGTVNVSGAGSQLVIAGVGGLNTQGIDGAGGILDVGRNQGFGGGTGTLNVTNGGSVLISDNGLAATSGGLRLRVASGADTTGTVLVSGPGSSIVVSSTGGGATFPNVVIGNGGTAQMTISSGGLVSVLGSGERDFIVGNSATGSGTLNVTTGGQVNASWFAVGNNGGSGTATIDNATVSLDGFVDFNTGIGAGVRVGRGVGANGVLNLQNGAAINIANSLPDSSVVLGGTSTLTGGTGTLNMSGGSTITFTGTAAGAAMSIGGQDGNGLMTMTGSSIVNTGTTGVLRVGSSTGSNGNLTIGGGSKIFANTAGIGGNSDDNAGGIGNAVVSGAGSQLKLAGDSGFLGVGRNGVGSLTVSSQGEVAATIINVGRAAGGVGTMSVDNGVINLSGQQTSGSQSGAGLSIGNRGGTGSVSITNGSVVTITNNGSAGAGLYIGGTPLGPQGNGTLTVSNAAINVIAAPGLATARIGYDGNGTATFTNSRMNLGSGPTLPDGAPSVSDGVLSIAGQSGSTGTLVLNAGSVVNAGYVGVGARPSGLPAGSLQPAAGAGVLVVNNSTVNATSTFEIGALGVLTGNNGVINVLNGDVIVGGTINPGQSPGRIRINCNLVSLNGSKLILEIQDDGSGGYEFDQLVIDQASTFDLKQLQIVFSFLGDTDPTAFAESGGLDLDNFLRVGRAEGEEDDPLSELLDFRGQAWTDVVTLTNVTAESGVFDITSLSFDAATGSFGVIAAPIPEPSTWALILLGFLLIAASRARTLGRVPSALTRRGHVATCS
jgi:T5SS/PEP-CTERM-associated repeat protein